MAQIAATALGVEMSCVKVLTGDTDKVPYGGGTWASRAAGIGGEAVLQASLALKHNILEVGAVILKTSASELDIVDGKVVKKGTEQGLALAELARICYYRGNELPVDFQPELVVTRHYRVKDYAFVFSNGAQGCHLEVDIDTGFVKLLKMWCVDDCGRVINPKLVDEQARGGIVQGIGGALYEHCLYDDRDANEDFDARRQGRGRSRDRRRAGSDHERGERRAAAAGGEGDQPADNAGSRFARSRESSNVSEAQ
jgi:carbon-monoxide dehydrogenase large subunit